MSLTILPCVAQGLFSAVWRNEWERGSASAAYLDGLDGATRLNPTVDRVARREHELNVARVGPAPWVCAIFTAEVVRRSSWVEVCRGRVGEVVTVPHAVVSLLAPVPIYARALRTLAIDSLVPIWSKGWSTIAQLDLQLDCHCTEKEGPG